MAELTTTTSQAIALRGGPGIPAWLGPVQKAVLRGEVFLAFGVVALLVVLILPMPPWLLDLSLALSMTMSVLILMVVLFIERPLEFSSFPIVLLVSTMLRLALNMASVRLILGHGHEGTRAAGGIIESFGNFVMGGNYVIGVIVFAILVTVNFMVITRGSGRIAEVAARFTLDAMPGKQLAIDADLGSGLIDEAGAKKRRADLEGESNFFGAMDGASKFVRGDAIAGLIITAINIIAGLIIGIVQRGMPVGQALSTYTLLTVGDGLVSQIPAIIVSLAAGIMVSKGNIQNSIDRTLFHQFSAYPAALGMVSFLATALALLPGVPFLPFVFFAGLTGWAAWRLPRMRAQQAAATQAAADAAAPVAPVKEEPIATALQIDLCRLELGYGLLPLVNDERGNRLTDQIKALRRQLASDMGFVMPAVRIQDNLQLASNTYVIRIKEIEAGRGELRPNMLLVMDPRGEPITLPGEATVEPTFGLPALWIADHLREEATFRGLTVVDPQTVITTHLTELMKDNMAELLSYTETQKLLLELDKEHQKLIAELIPALISTGGVQRVLQNLLHERISIRDLATILEGVAEACGYTRNITSITEHVRSRLARQISDANMSDAGYIPLVTLSPQWEQAFAESIVSHGEDKQLSMAPSRLQEFIVAVRQAFDRFAMVGESPALLTSPTVRPYVRSIVERFRPATVIMSQNEVHPKARIKTLGQI
ncbi:MAG: flagellar biosynthesis protein FlhA [Aliidongia sp.]